MLFNLNVNDLSKVVKYCEMESYVDDTKLYLAIYQQRNNTVLRNKQICLYIYIGRGLLTDVDTSSIVDIGKGPSFFLI